MKEVWLIDGYNVLHDPSVREIFQGSKISREVLFGLLSGFAATHERTVRVVLDGVGPQEEMKPYETKYFEVIYSEKVSADTCIEKYLYENRNHAKLVVVTRDIAISNIARGGGASVIQPAELVRLLRESRKEDDDILHKGQVKSHGFNRPFEKKLKDL